MKFFTLITGLFLSATIFAMTEVELSPGDLSFLFSQKSTQFSPQQKQTNSAEEEYVGEFNLSGLFSQTSNPGLSPLKTSQDQYTLENFILLSQQSVGWDIEFSDSRTEITNDVFGEDSDAEIDDQKSKKKKRKLTSKATNVAPTRKSDRAHKPKKRFE